MIIVEINALPNGAHRNQNGGDVLPDGWAVVPNGMTLENFPFGEVTAEEVDGIMTVIKWTAGSAPDPEPAPAPEPTEMERLRADIDYIAALTGVEL